MRLMLMRHSQTENLGEKADIQRELTDSGRGDAAQAADFLNNYQVDKVLVSPATRTMQTAKIITDKITLREFEIAAKLYEGDEDKIIDLIASQENDNKNILVIGHNPLIYNVAMYLANNDSKDYNKLIESMMPTSRIIIIDFNNIDSWESVNQGIGNIFNIFTPSC